MQNVSLMPKVFAENFRTKLTAILFAVFCWVSLSSPVRADDAVLTVNRGPSSAVLSVAYSSSGKYVAAGMLDGCIKIFDAKTGTELRTLVGHRSWVYALSFSHDGASLVSGSADGTLKIWDAGKGTLLNTLKGHKGFVQCAVYSPDDKQIASGSTDHTIKLWDSLHGNEIATFQGHSDFVSSIAFSTDGKTLVSGSGDRCVRVWDIAKAITNSSMHADSLPSDSVVLQAHTNPVARVAIDSSGKYIASESLDGCVIVWDAKKHQEIRRAPPKIAGIGIHLKLSSTHQLLIDSLEVNGCAERAGLKPGDIVTAVDQKSIDKLSLQAASELIRGRYGSEVQITVSRGDKFITEKIERTVGLVRSNEITPMVHTDWLVSNSNQLELGIRTEEFLSFTTGAKALIVGTRTFDDRSEVYIWDWQKNSTSLTIPDENLQSVSVSPDEKTLVIGERNAAVKVFSLNTGTKTLSILSHKANIISLDFSGDGKCLVSRSASLRFWDFLAGSPRTVPGEVYEPGSQATVSYTLDKLFVNDAQSGKPLLSESRIKLTNVGDISKDRTLLLLNKDYSSQFWGPSTIEVQDIKTQKTLGSVHTSEQNKRITVACFSPDGKLIATSESFGNVRDKDVPILIWDASALRQIVTLRGHVGMVTKVVFSQDGKRMLSASTDGSLRIWDCLTWKQINMLSHFSDYDFDLSGDGNLIAMQRDPDSVSVLDSTSGNVLHTFRGDIHAPIKFSPDGKKLFVGSADGIKVFDIVAERHLCTLIPLDENDWAVVDPVGRFDCSSGSTKLLSFRVGAELIDLAQLKQRFYEPGLLSKLLGSNKEPLRPVSSLRDIKLYPDVTAEVNPSKNSLMVHLKNQGGGIGKLEVRVNGKELAADATPRELNRKANETTVQIDLSKVRLSQLGKNSVTLVSHNAEGDLSSRDIVVDLPEKLSAPPHPSAASSHNINFYGIVGGISRYADGNLNLRYAAKDADDFATALNLGAKKLFGVDKVHIRLLNATDLASPDAPTKENFRKAFELLVKSKPEDIVVVYLAGHGTTLGNSESKYFYLTADSRSADIGDSALLEQTALSSGQLAEWVKNVPALKQVLILDTCHGGAAAADLIAHRDIPSDQIRAIDRLKDRVGFHILMGCAANSVSYEASRYGQGLLTYSLLQGMKGAALRDNEFVDVETLFQHAADAVPRLAGEVGGIQRPIIAAPEATSFDVGQVGPTERGAIPLANTYPLVLKPKLVRTDDYTDSPLELSLQLRKCLEANSENFSRDDAKKFVFVDADDFSDAVKPTGGYTVDGKDVTVHLALVQKGQRRLLSPISGSTDNVDKLVQDMANAIEHECTK